MANAGLTASLTKAQLDSQMGAICQALDGVMGQIEEMRQFLLATVDATLLAAPFGYAQGDINVFKSAFVDLDNLRQIYQGVQSQSVLLGNSNAFDFRSNAKLIWGTGVH